ncbi:MAG: mucoidy inhibitor MuiA family protein [Hyphomicrobiaceae bacterium]
MMCFRSTAILAGALLLAGSGWTVPVHAEPVTVTSQIEAVTVFPSGAEIMRTGKARINLQTGAVVFSDLPPETIPGSIRVDGKSAGKFSIGAVDTRRLFVPQHSGVDAETERKRIEKEIEALDDKRKIAEAKVSAADTQRTLIGNLTNLPNRPLPAAGSTAPAEDWPAIISLIQTSLSDVAQQRLQAEADVRDLEQQIKDMRGKLAALAPSREERTEVRVTVTAEQDIEADFTVRYQVPNASWSPSYDARLTTGSKATPPSLEIMRRATITQRTGEAWENVALQLSTTRPGAGTAAPKLATMTVDYRPPVRPAASVRRGADYESRQQPSASPQAMDAAPASEPIAAPPMRLAKRDLAAVTVAAFQATYGVSGRVTVANTGEAKSIDLASDSFAPSLIARTVPKRDAKAYLYAKIDVPRGSPMLPGAVALFRDGTFVGNGRLPLLAGGEDHELGFGSDDLVRVRHSIVKETRGETGLISSSATDERNYRIAVKNLHERAIDVSVFDHLPVSRNQEIKVTELGKPSPTAHDVDDKAGVVRWDFQAEPDEEKTIDFGYRVTWPSDKSVRYRGQ